MHLISIIVEKIIFFYYKNFIIITLSFCSNIFGQKNRCVRACSVIRENGKLYKQNYYKIFLSTKEYELIDFRSLDCKSMKLNSTNNSNELVSATLLRKSFNRLRI